MKKIIIDADPGIDDSIAIMLANSIEEYDIIGISLVSGNVHINKGRKNILRLEKFLGRKFKIQLGSEAPLYKEFINAEDTHGEDGLGETYLDYDDRQCEKDAIDFLIEEARKGDLTIFALGPLTNIAKAIKRDKEAFKDTRIIVMGGSFRSHGNMSPVAEFNFYVDPDAADYVIKNSPRKIEIVPLDVTRKFVLSPSILAYIKRLNPEVGNFIEKITNFYMDFHWEYEKIIGSVINDPLTILLERNPDWFTSNTYNVECVTEGPARGMLMVDEMNFMKREDNIIIYEDLDLFKVWKYFIEKISKEETDMRILGDLLWKSQQRK